MATGFTYKVESGEMTRFDEFALQYATLFTPFQNLDIRNGVPDVIEPDISYVQDCLEICKVALEKMLRSDNIYAAKRYNAYIADIELLGRKQDNERNIANYHSMLTKVENWQPDVGVHFKMKESMISSLKESMEFDYIELHPTTKIMKFEEYVENEIKTLRADIAVYEEDIKAEIQEAEANNKLLQKLKASIKSHSNKVDA